MKPLEESTQLSCQVEGDDVVIRIGSALLLHAIQHGPGWDESWTINNPEAFIQEIVENLENEEEDGTTLLHQALDDAAVRAVENGSEHVDCNEYAADDGDE